MKRAWLVLLGCACSAPGSGLDSGVPDSGSPDAAVADAGSSSDAGVADAGDPYRYWDGGSCAVKTDCPCFSNEDCGPGYRCVSEDTTGTNVWCVPGARGTGAAGAPCTGEADCASALCVEPSTGVKLCSALCDVASECPASLPRCLYIGFGVDRSICSPP